MHLAEAEMNTQEREERRIAGQLLARGKPAARQKERWKESREARE